jgi:fumarate hydratase class I
MQFLFASLLELIIETSTNLPPDVRRAMGEALAGETPATQSQQALNIIATNIDMAHADEGAICQDTGMPTFVVHAPAGVNQIGFAAAIREAVAEATRRGKLRPNSVDSLSGKNSGNNLSAETPVIHFEQWEQDQIEVKLLLKGGGCENKNIQYSLPCELEHLGRAGRDLAGVKKCLLHAVWQAQGQGCAPGALGVCIGSDRAHGYLLAKYQLFRTLDDSNAVPELAQLEAEIMTEANRLGVGAMGFGGKASLIGCKIMAANRLPASFFVSVAYDCWAFRRLGLVLDPETGAIRRWLYRDPELPVQAMAAGEGFPLTGREVVLTAPLTSDQMRTLKVGDVVLIRGEMYTGRDAVHAYLMKNSPPVDLDGAVLYHCGPVMLKEGGEWQVKAAGPTTSMREEPYEADDAALRRQGGDGQGRHGAEDAGGAQRVRRGVPERHRRRGAILRANGRKSARCGPARTRHSGSDVALAGEGLRGHRDHGRARQQPARQGGGRDRAGAGCDPGEVGFAGALEWAT